MVDTHQTVAQKPEVPLWGRATVWWCSITFFPPFNLSLTFQNSLKIQVYPRLKRTRAGETWQGRMRRFDGAIARFVGGNFNCHFCRALLWCSGHWRPREPWDLTHAKTLISPVHFNHLTKRDDWGLGSIVPTDNFRKDSFGMIDSILVSISTAQFFKCIS